MIVVYDSLTGQGKKFANSLGLDTIHIKLYNGNPSDKIFLVTRSINFGLIPSTTASFLSNFHNQVIGLAVSGNRNWGENFGAAGDKINQQYNIPLVLKFEMSGSKKDIEYVKQWIENHKEGSVE